jgi:uncharacterized protein involved in oxidation of intracellular sulfur
MVIIATHGPDDPERATFAFVMGNGALAMDAEVVAILQGSGVMLAKKGCYEHIAAAGLPPLKKLVDDFVELGGKVLVCGPCIKERNIAPEMLIDGAETIATARAVSEALEANAVLNY